MAKVFQATDKFKTVHPLSYWGLRNYQVDKEKRIAQFVWRAYRDAAEGKLKDENGNYIGSYFDTYFFTLNNGDFDMFISMMVPPGQPKHIEEAAYVMAMTRQDKTVQDPAFPGDPTKTIKVAFFKDATDDLT